MSTTEISRPKKRKSSQADSQQATGGGLRWRLFLFLALVVGALYFAPTIVARTPLRNWVFNRFVPIKGTFSVARASLAWFSSVELEGLEIRDAQGEQVLVVGSVASEKPLVALLLDLPDLGRLRVTRPELHVVAHDKDSNLEQVFAQLFDSPSDARPTAQVELIEGSVSVADVAAGRQFQFSKLTAKCDVSDSVEVSASGDLTEGRQAGSFKIDLVVKGLGAAAAAHSGGKIDCQSSAVPLELLEPLLRRRVAGARLAGLVSTRLMGAWGEMAGGGDSSLDGEIMIRDLDFSTAALHEDHVHFQQLEIPCHVVQKGDWVQVDKLAVRSELGEVSLTGSARISDLTAPNRLARLAHDSCELRGQIDLARLAAMLPSTLKLRQGTEITSGHLAFDVVARPQADGIEWTSHVDTGPLAATVAGHAVSWDKPLAIELSAHENKQGIVLDRGRCTSSFLQIEAEGSPSDWTASADFDLAQLISELRRFCDLDDVKLAGHGQAQLVYKHTGDDQFWARAEFHARGFQWSVVGSPSWNEDAVLVMLETSGRQRAGEITRVDQAHLTVTADGERAEAQLREAVANPSQDAWPLQCTWSGDVAHWAPRLESGLGISGWQLTGTGTAQGIVLASPKTIELGLGQAALAHVKLAGHGYYVDEPAAKIELAGTCDLATGRIEVRQGKLSAGTVEAETTRLVVEREDSGLSLELAAQISAELAQVYHWQHDPRTPATWQVAGKLTGAADLKVSPNGTSAQLDGVINDLEISDRSPGAARAADWRESRVNLAARVAYQPSGERLQLDKLQVACQGLRCDASGALAMAQGGSVEINGTLDFDWEQLAPLWRPYLGEQVAIAGRQTREFSVRGQLSGDVTKVESWHGVTADASVSWTGANVFGLMVGRGEVAVRMADGQARSRPIDVEISEGRLTLVPALRLEAKPMDVILGQGPLLTDVHLSPQLCAQGLKFVAPVLADSTTADGRFSMTIEGGRIPLSDPRTADVGGVMAMRAQAKPGPVAREFLVLIRELTTILQRGPLAKLTDQDGALVSVDDSSIEFRCVNGRVYHRGLNFKIGTLPISTYGSVGFDESLSIVAEVPVRAELFGLDLSLGALEGRVVQIPIGGTLANPKLDPVAMQQLAGQALQNTARGVLIDGVGRQLERLLPPKQ